MKNLKQLLKRLFCKAHVMPRYFVPQSQLFHLTIGKKYLITYTKEGRQIKDDRGIKKIVRPLPSEIQGEVQK